MYKTIRPRKPENEISAWAVLIILLVGMMIILFLLEPLSYKPKAGNNPPSTPAQQQTKPQR